MPCKSKSADHSKDDNEEVAVLDKSDDVQMLKVDVGMLVQMISEKLGLQALFQGFSACYGAKMI